MREKIARWIIGHRWIFLGIMTLITAFFAVGAAWVDIRTIFSDLFPDNHELVHTFKDHPNFGSPLTVQVMVKVKDGTIYNPETLNKVWEMTRDIDLAPSVDHDQVLSISTEKARFAEATPFGIESFPLMGDAAPKTEEGMREFVTRVEKAPGVARFLISPDGTATLIQATFIEHSLDYGEAHEYVQGLVERNRDANHEIYAAGEPMMIGWVYYYQHQMIYIFMVTLALMLIALVLYMRNVAGVVTPIAVSIVGAIWGFGTVGWIGFNVEPLILVVPLLLIARSFSHCVQMTERYYEVLHQIGDKQLAAMHAMRLLMAPGVLGIVTDAIGLFLIGVAPIPMMEKFALFCGFWALYLIPTNALLTPVLLALLPVPRNVDEIVDPEKQAGIHNAVARLLTVVGSLSHGRRAIPTTIVIVLVAIGAGYAMSQIKLGNIQEGSSILKPDAEYNVAVGMLNNNFPGMNTLEIILEGKEQRAMASSDAVRTMSQIQRMIETSPEPPTATLSYADYLPEAYRLFSGGNPKWLPLDYSDEVTKAASFALLAGNSPKNYGHVVDYDITNGTISLWYRDRTQPTLDRALAQARAAVNTVGADHEQFLVRLGSGSIALQYALNEAVHLYSWLILAYLMVVIFITVSIAYRSPVAGILLLIPVNLSNLLLMAVMVAMNIGLDVNTLPVTAIGVGVGIDYGIYLLSRICEEYAIYEDYEKAIDASVSTTGKAIFFTASIVLVGILPWYFLSELKFLADMGLLLVLIMLINMVVALVLVPLLVYWMKPRFVRKDLALFKESLELEELATAHGHGHRPATAPSQAGE